MSTGMKKEKYLFKNKWFFVCSEIEGFLVGFETNLKDDLSKKAAQKAVIPKKNGKSGDEEMLVDEDASNKSIDLILKYNLNRIFHILF